VADAPSSLRARMAQELIRRFVADLKGVEAMPDPVYDFGSLQVQADQDADLRPLFTGRPFTGVDMRAGAGVDAVMDLRALELPSASVGTALCLDTLEHCEDPPQACRELARVTAPGGLCVLASVMLFGIHAYPSDYFRFTPAAFRSMLGQGFDDVWAAGIGNPGFPSQVVGVGANGRALDRAALDALPALQEAQSHYDAGAGRVRVGVFNYEPRQLVRALVAQAPRLLKERRR
jgi:SAM-dependent methyltransferase